MRFHARIYRKFRQIDMEGSREQLIKDLRDMKGAISDEDVIQIYAVFSDSRECAYIGADEEEKILKEAGL